MLLAKRSTMNLITLILTLFLAISVSAKPSPESNKPVATSKNPASSANGKRTGAAPGQIHTLDQIEGIIKASNLYYSVETLMVISPNAYMGDTARPVLPGSQHVKIVDGLPSLVNYKLSNIGIPLMGMAAGSFKDKDYAGAVNGYKRLLGTDPSFDLALSYIGESYLMEDSLDSAGVYLTKALVKNYSDFTSHRLLGEVFWKSGNRTDALKELTTAHVLNVNDQKIRGQLEEWRLLSGRLWTPQPIDPKFRILKIADTVFVKAPLEWVGYAMVKAVWKYDPGYAKRMLGQDPAGSAYIMMEEKEALVGALTTYKKLSYINPAIQQGYLEELILYELVAPRYPMNIAVLPKEVIERIVEYVDKFH